MVRAAAVAAALQATPDGGRLRQVLPDRPLPARRGPACRPPAGVHPARPGNVVRRDGRHLRRHRGADRGVFQSVPRRRDPAAAAAAQYADAMLKYGSDKPDLRYGLEIVDCSDLAAQTEFKVFQDVVAAGGKVRASTPRGPADKFSRKDLDELDRVRQPLRRQGAGLDQGRGRQVHRRRSRSSCRPQCSKACGKRLNAEAGDLLLFVADKEDVVCQALGALRTHLASI